jgi:hypothetical protein
VGFDRPWLIGDLVVGSSIRVKMPARLRIELIAVRPDAAVKSTGHGHGALTGSRAPWVSSRAGSLGHRGAALLLAMGSHGRRNDVPTMPGRMSSAGADAPSR